MFKKAERKKAKLRLALSGTSGSGKTYGALQIAKGIGGKVAVLDTERGSASLYADMMDFDVVELGPPYEPERFIEVMDAAAKAGYDILIIDSITHEWKGAGGMLEIVDNIARAKFRGNSYAAWNEGDKRHRRFIDAMLHSPLHIIVTMRSKAVYVEGERNGKKTIEKQGAAPEQRDGIEYEFTAVLDLTVDGNLAVKSKDRTRLFNDPFRISEDTGRKLREWLESGAEAQEPAPSHRPAPAAPAQTITDPIEYLAELYAGDEEEVMMDDINERLRAAAKRQCKPFEPVDTLRDLSTPLATWLIKNITAQRAA
jgi:KaiC/GvpD/RAD55 family RecA-like ATPase